jgi:uncharacterized repeat protein (TIGR01451 family)
MQSTKHSEKEMHMRKSAASFIVVAAALIATAAWGAPNLEIKVKAEKAKVVSKDGQKVTRMVVAKNFTPGEVIHYTVLYRNTGNEDATNAVVSDPIPNGTVYIPGSASDTGEVTFSIDGGKTFKKPALLSYEMKTAAGTVEKRVASPEEYTHIRWVINKIPAGSNGKVSFQVKVK